MHYNTFDDGLNEMRNILYKQVDDVATLNKLLSTLLCEIQNLENYKTNIAGDSKYIYKVYIKNLINKLRIYKEKITELIKIKNGYPIFELSDIENISLIKTLPSMDYKTSIINSNMKIELNSLYNQTNESLIEIKKNDDYQSINLLNELLFIIKTSLIEISS